MSRPSILQQDNIGYIACIVLLLFSLVRFPTDSMRVSFQLMAEVGTIIAFAVLIWEINKWISMFLIFTCLSSLYPQYDKATFLASHAVFYGIVWYYIISKVKDCRIFLDAICIIAVVNTFFLVLQYFNIDPLTTPIGGGKDICTGLMSNRNETSALLAICLPAFLRKKRYIFIPFVMLGLVLSKSFGGVLAVSVGLGYYIFIKFDIKHAIIFFLAIILIYLIVDKPGINQRLDNWIIGFKSFLEHPFIGAGIGHWKYVFSSISTDGGSVMLTAHNDFLQGAFELGILFIILLLGYFISLYKRLKTKNILFSVAVIIIIVNASVNFLFHIATTAYISLTWLSLIDRREHENQF